MPLVLYQDKLLYRKAYGGKLANSLDCCCVESQVCCADYLSQYTDATMPDLIVLINSDCLSLHQEQFSVPWTGEIAVGNIVWNVSGVSLAGGCVNFEFSLSCTNDVWSLIVTNDGQTEKCIISGPSPNTNPFSQSCNPFGLIFDGYTVQDANPETANCDECCTVGDEVLFVIDLDTP